MKQIVFAISGITLSLLLSTNKVSAQAWSATIPAGDLITNSSTHNVGIADNSPTDKLSINGNLGFTTSTGAVRTIMGRTRNYMEIYSASQGDVSASGGPAIFMFSNSHTTYGNPGSVHIRTTGTVLNNRAFEVTRFDASSIENSLLRINLDGKVIIGNNININPLPGDYKLYVEKGILTEKLKVAVNGTSQWSDYVFADNYDLKPLDEVESFINENKHLPDVPSADEMVKSGLDVATMDAKLLQKIEELTLYVIDQQKQIAELKTKLNK